MATLPGVNQTINKTLTNAQILKLNTEPFELLPAIPGFYYILTGASIQAFVTTDYSFDGDDGLLGIYLEGDTASSEPDTLLSTQISGQMVLKPNSTSVAVNLLGVNPYPDVTLRKPNRALLLRNTETPVGGDSTNAMSVTVSYIVLDAV